MPDHPLRVFSGSAHPELAQEIAAYLGVPLGQATTYHLPDSEIHVMAEGKAYFSVTHPLLLPTAMDILNVDDRIEKLVVTNTIPLPKEKKEHPKIEVLSIARLLGDTINNIHEGISISEKVMMA